MEHIVTVQDAVTAFADFMEPTDAELDAIEREMSVILADVELLDAHIVTLDRTPTELDDRRIRRARRRALAARVALLNRTVGASVPGVPREDADRADVEHRPGVAPVRRAVRRDRVAHLPVGAHGAGAHGAERRAALAALGYEVAPGAVWSWTEDSRVPDDDSTPVLLIAAVTVRDRDGVWHEG